MSIRSTLGAIASILSTAVGVLLVTACVASATPTTTQAANYAAFTSVQEANYVGADTGFKAESWHLEYALSDSAHNRVEVHWVWDGHNLGGAGQAESVYFQAYVYDEFVSCGPPNPDTNLNLGIVTVSHWHASLAGGGQHGGTYSTPCK